MFDIIVVGGGVVGCAVLDKLAMKGYSCALLEADDDVAVGASRANSGIVHAGYDAVPGTKKAKYNVRGAYLMPSLAKELDVPYKNTGSLVVAGENGMAGLEELMVRAAENGVQAEILDREAILKIEPNVSDAVRFALYAPTAGIISPYKLTIALADRAATNGAKVFLNRKVVKIEKADGKFVLETESGEKFEAKMVVNSAGAGAADISDLAGAEHFDVAFARGDYFVLDVTEGKNVSTVIFPLPDEKGKGILVAPTADGNVIYGPTSIKERIPSTDVTSEGLDAIRKGVEKTYKCPNYRKVIRLFAGVRAICGDDFVMEESKKVNNFVNLVGICSPGLSSAPAIAEWVESVAEQKGFAKNTIEKTVKLHHNRLKELSEDKINELVKADSRYGRIICRCEKITEGEIVEAIHAPVPATTVDAVKRRVRAGMGRCQGGFCAPRVMEILARELNIPVTEVKKGGKNSFIAIGKIKED